MDNTEAIRIFQQNCIHNRGRLTNTGSEGAKCVMCGATEYQIMQQEHNKAVTEQAEKLLSTMPKGNARIYCANIKATANDQQTKKFWEDVINEIDKKSTNN